MSLYSRNPNNSTRLTTQMLRETSGVADILGSLFFYSGIPIYIAPQINIISYTNTKLSNVDGKNSISITFNSNKDLSEWEIRADGNGVGSGDLIAKGGSLSSNTNYTLYANQLTWGDRVYRINIYGKSTEGLWNTYE